MVVDQAAIWLGSVTKSLHPSHRMVDDPNYRGHQECTGCGSGTRNGIPELVEPCSYVLDYMPHRAEAQVPARWENVYARVEPGHWFDDSLKFTLVYRDVKGHAYTSIAFVSTSDLERYPHLFGDTFERLIKQLEDELPPF